MSNAHIYQIYSPIRPPACDTIFASLISLLNHPVRRAHRSIVSAPHTDTNRNRMSHQVKGDSISLIEKSGKHFRFIRNHLSFRASTFCANEIDFVHKEILTRWCFDFRGRSACGLLLESELHLRKF